MPCLVQIDRLRTWIARLIRPQQCANSSGILNALAVNVVAGDDLALVANEFDVLVVSSNLSEPDGPYAIIVAVDEDQLLTLTAIANGPIALTRP